MYSAIKISEFLHRKKEIVEIDPDAEYSLVTVKLHHKGVVLREKKKGRLLGSSMYKISKGQFILSGIDARNGAFGIVPDELDGAIITNDFWCFDIDEKKVKRDFFYWLSNTPLFLDACVKSSKGETQRIRLQKDLFFNFKFHFPPINMQEDFLRGIQKFDFGLSVLGSEQTYQSSHLTLLRQSILQEGIEGKLTAKWREQHLELISGNNHALKLLEKIKAEKERLIKEGKIKKDKPLALIVEDEKLFDLPDGWVWCRLGDVGNAEAYPFIDGPFGSSINTKKDYINTGIPVLRMLNVKPFKFLINNLKYVSPEIFDTLKRHNVQPNDILFSKVGAGIGEACMVPKDFTLGMLATTGITRLRVGRIVMPEYLCIFLNVNSNRFKSLSCNTAQPFLNMSMIKMFPFALPPLAEQQVIVKWVVKLMVMIDELEKQVSEREEQSEMLMQSVLREAFADNKYS